MRSRDEIPTPEGKAFWDHFTSYITPYLISSINNDLFARGRENDLLDAVCFAICQRIKDDKVPISGSILRTMLCDICSLMPAFESIQDIPSVVDEFLTKMRLETEPRGSVNSPTAGG